ncbi:uncharacterized protein LY79DRAFT_557345 [Colletotrichum navitas]|uniref:Uncharacterized protein n=1 Tax=Colletotrichum navitas TaxID=681940 RepID=A0AAD8V4R4_9PEZI|nr:uncharacterized protein LY79DRAFT_557345 [Colletotrichum navitas]KAK1586044.1 hypothetical protein LY79DRAFT_557345 [Colletotrichum navitas]
MEISGSWGNAVLTLAIRSGQAFDLTVTVHLPLYGLPPSTTTILCSAAMIKTEWALRLSFAIVVRMGPPKTRVRQRRTR